MSDYTDLIDALRAEGRDWREQVGEMPMFDRAADAIEALVKERDDLKREMLARELHHFEEEQKSAGLAAVIEKALYMSDGQNMARVLREAPVDALREHDATLIESLANEFCSDPLDYVKDYSSYPGPQYEEGVTNRETWRRWFVERARQVREGEA